MAESRVLPLFMKLPMRKPRILALLLALIVSMAIPLSACASPSVLPEDKPAPGNGSIPASTPTGSSISSLGDKFTGGYDVPSWGELVVLTGAQPGPVLMVIAGVHGDEASGPMAARRLASGPPPARGTLVILPVAFPEALAAGQRWLPGWSDLNRAFPQDGEWGASGTAGKTGSAEAGGVTRSARSAYAESDPAYRRADEILVLIACFKPALLLDLHESDQYWTEGDSPALVVPASVNSPESARSAELALALLESPGLEGVVFTGPPPAGSLVAAVDGLLGFPALLVEAPDALTVDDRIAVYYAVVAVAMRILGME